MCKWFYTLYVQAFLSLLVIEFDLELIKFILYNPSSIAIKKNEKKDIEIISLPSNLEREGKF